MQEIIDQAKGSFLHSKKTLLRSLETTPDDRLNWSPSPTSRTAVHQVAHAAASMKAIHEMMEGRPFSISTREEADKGFREWEQQFTTREAVIELVERNSADYLAWLDGLTEERLTEMVTLPFGIGQAPLQMALTFIPMHTNWHAAQIDYIQTIYGDLDWHAGGAK